MLKVSTLANGLHVVSYQMPTVKSVHLRLSVKGGSLVENKKNNGVAHFMEHMLVQGIPSYPTAEELSQYVESLAGNYNAYTSIYTVAFTMTVPALHLGTMLGIASEVFFAPLFTENAIEKERQAVINELMQDMDSPWFDFTTFFLKTRNLKNSVLNLRTIGTLDTVNSLTKEDLKSYWKSFFVPKNTYLLVTGNFDQKELSAYLEKYFGIDDSRKFRGFNKHSSEDFSNKKVAIRHDERLSVNYLNLCFPSVGLTSDLKTRIGLDIALIILGGLQSSRLFRLLRYQRGLVYGVNAKNDVLPNTGITTITSEATTENLDQVLDLVIKELESYIKTGPTEDKLTMAKNYLTNAWMMAFDNPHSIANWLEGELLWSDGDRVRAPEDYIEFVEQISTKTIKEAIDANWELKKINLILQGPLTSSAENLKKYTSMISSIFR